MPPLRLRLQDFAILSYRQREVCLTEASADYLQWLHDCKELGYGVEDLSVIKEEDLSLADNIPLPIEVGRVVRS